MTDYKLRITFKKCRICGKSPVIHRIHSDELLCTECFCRKIEEIISTTIIESKMIEIEDRIVVGMSGGKDSIALLYNLDLLKSNLEYKCEIIALIIDEGIFGYRNKSIKVAEQFCKDLNIEYKIISFKETTGKSLDEIVKYKKESSEYLYSCNYCAIIRRRLLNEGTKELGGNVLAVGHNLTDLAETYLMNVLYKRFNLISQKKFKFNNPDNDRNSKFVKKIKPLMYIPEEEIFLYNSIKKLPFYPSHCPYSKKEPIIRRSVLEFIQQIKKTYPEIEMNLLEGYQTLSLIFSKFVNKNPSMKCPQCGYPSKANFKCSYCQLISELEK